MEIRKLNTLRALASFIVIISHYSNGTMLFGGFLGFGAGQFGGMLFFLLSGFLIAYLYLQKPFCKETLFSYCIARSARILPLFIVLVFVSYGMEKAGITGLFYKIDSKEVLFANLALLAGENVLWTVPTEIQFYAIFVLLWWLWQKRPQQLYLPLLVLLFLLYIDVPRYKGSILAIPYDSAILPSLPYFMVGFALGLLYKNWQAPKRFMQRNFLLCLLVIPLLYPKIYHALMQVESTLWQDGMVLLIMAILFFVVVFLVPDDCRLLSNKVGDFLGKITYSIYLLHMPVLLGMFRILPGITKSPLLFLPLFLLLTILIAYISYIVVEQPCRKAIRSIQSSF